MGAEYTAYATTLHEIEWTRGVVTELGVKEFELSGSVSPTILSVDSKSMDSKSAMYLAPNP